LCQTFDKGNLYDDFLTKLKTRSTSDLLSILDFLSEFRLFHTADCIDVTYYHGQ